MKSKNEKYNCSLEMKLKRVVYQTSNCLDYSLRLGEDWHVFKVGSDTQDRLSVEEGVVTYVFQKFNFGCVANDIKED